MKETKKGRIFKNTVKVTHNMSKKEENKYLENKIGLIQASVAGTQIGANFLGLEGKTWHYDYGVKIRELIDKDIRQIYKYAFNQGKKSPLNNK